MGRRGDPTDGGSSDSPEGPRIKKEPGVCEETQAVPGGPADDGSGNEAAEAGRAQSAVCESGRREVPSKRGEGFGTYPNGKAQPQKGFKQKTSTP